MVCKGAKMSVRPLASEQVSDFRFEGHRLKLQESWNLLATLENKND